MTRLNMNEARSEALFASKLQPSDVPTAEVVAKAIDRAVQLYGVGGGSGQSQRRAPLDRGDHRLHVLGLLEVVGGDGRLVLRIAAA
jgi:hypothetical protein